MSVTRLHTSDSQDSSSRSLWFAGLLLGGSVATAYCLYRSRRATSPSQHVHDAGFASDFSRRCSQGCLVVVYAASASELKDIVSTSSTLGVTAVWVVTSGHVQIEADLEDTYNVEVRLFATLEECCKAMRTEEWQVYIASMAEPPLSQQMAPACDTDCTRAAVIVSADEVPQCLLHAAKRTLYAGNNGTLPDLLRHALQQLKYQPVQDGDTQTDACRSHDSIDSSAAVPLPLSSSTQIDSNAERVHSDSAEQEQSAAASGSGDAHDLPADVSKASDHPESSDDMSSNSQQDPDETLEIGNEQPSDSITGHAQSPSQQAVQPVPANLHAQPSPLHSSSSPSSSTSSHSQRSASESPNEEAHQFSLPTLSMQAPNPSKPKTHLSADRKPSGSQERSPPEALHQSTSANLSSQAPSTSKTEMQPSVDSAPFASGNPHTTSQQFSSAIQVSSPSKSVTQSSPSSSVAGAHMQPQQSPKQNASAASTGSEADGEAVPQSPSSQLAAQQRGDSNLAPNVSSQSLNGSPSCMNSQESAALGKASPVPRKPWQRNDVTQHAASASQSASASASLPFWQRQDRAADAASHQPTAVPFWLRKDASHTDAASADDTASVQSEPAPVPFWQRGSTSTTRDASDAASDIGTSTSVPSVWQRSVSDVYKGAPNMTASHSGSAPVPFWQSGDRRTDTFIPHSAAAASQHSSRSSTDSGVSAPAHMPFWQNKHPPVNSAASAPIAVPFWQTRQTGTAAPQLTSQASSNSVASSSTGPGSDYNPRVLTAQRALFEAQGSTPSTSRAPQLSHLGSANPAVASSSPASNSQASDIAKLQAQAMRRSGVLRRHVGDSRAGSSLGSPTGSVASVATSAWPDTPRSRR